MARIRPHKFITAWALLLLSTAPSPLAVWAASDPFAGIEVLSDRELDMIRGGYISHQGVEIYFGIEKATFIDGILQSTNVLSIPRLSEFLNRQDTLRPQTAAEMTVLQSQLFELVQNNQDGKIIDHLTIINMTVTNRQMLRDLNLSSQLRNAVVRTLP